MKSQNQKPESVLAEEGPAAPPRANGELIFEAPWQSRIFGITLALYEAGRFEWAEFQAQLIDAIRDHEAEIGQATEDDESAFDYYACWLEAFRELATSKRWLGARELEALEQKLLARPAGHDH